MATMWVLDDPRWRVDTSRPARSSIAHPHDGAMLVDLTRAPAAATADPEVLVQRTRP